MTNGRSEILELAPNEPQLVAIKYAEPKVVANGRAMFSLVDGRILFLDPPVAEKIIALGVRTGEPFAICLRWNGKRGTAKTYDVWRESDAAEPEQSARPARFGQQRDGTFAMPAAAPSAETQLERELRESVDRAKAGASARTPAPATTASQQPLASNQPNAISKPNGLNGHASPPDNAIGWAPYLLQQANLLIDVYAAALNHSDKYGATVKPDDVRSIVLSCFINVTKGSNGNGSRG